MTKSAASISEMILIIDVVVVLYAIDALCIDSKRPCRSAMTTRLCCASWALLGRLTRRVTKVIAPL